MEENGCAVLRFELVLTMAAASDWIAATAALVSAITALVGLWFARRQLLTQIADLKTRLQEIRATQAGTVTAWSERKEERGDGTLVRTVVAHNASQSPVYDVCVWLYSERSSDALNETVPPGRDPTARRAVLVPGEPLRYPVRVTGSSPAERPPVAMTFRDANGLAWFRPFAGGVVQMDPADPRPAP